MVGVASLTVMRRGGFSSRCCHRSGSDVEKRCLWTPMRHSLTMDSQETNGETLKER